MASKSVTIRDFRAELPGKLTDPHTYSFDQVISTNRNNKSTYWTIIVRLCIESNNKLVDENGDNPEDKFVMLEDSYFDSKTVIPQQAGRNIVGWIKVLSKTGDDGKVKKSPPTYVREGKNIGKANATNVLTQALRDALSKHNKQSAKSAEGDVVEIGGCEMYPPMLSQAYADQKNPVDWSLPTPKYVQYKFNGVRSIATLTTDGVVSMYSRTRKLYPGFSYLKTELSYVFQRFVQKDITGVYLDGEVYKHGVPLQIISGTARRELNESSQEIAQLEYHIYDLFIPARPLLTQTERFAILKQITDEIEADATTIANIPHLKFVTTWKIQTKAELDDKYNQALADGFEGLMLRLDKPYEYSYNDYHSKTLLKFKPTLDGEYKITGFLAGTQGKSEGALMFELEIPTPNGPRSLTINLGMELDVRKQLYTKMSEIEENGLTHFINKYKGKMLTIKYDELSEDGVPVRARTDGIIIRDYE